MSAQDRVDVDDWTAVFALVDGTLLRPLPYKEPARLVGLNAVRLDADGRQSPYSLSQIELVRWQAAAAFEAIEALESRTIAVTGGGGDPEVVQGGAVSSGLFPMLGLGPTELRCRSGRIHAWAA